MDSSFVLLCNECVALFVCYFCIELYTNIIVLQLRIIEAFRLLDDDFMNMVFQENIDAVELLLKIILQRDDIKVLEVVTQKEEKSPPPNGRTITLDIYAVDSAGKHYDIEVQRADKGDGYKRARFHSSVLDSRMLEAGKNFAELHDSYVIFITENDVAGAGLPMYHANRVRNVL